MTDQDVRGLVLALPRTATETCTSGGSVPLAFIGFFAIVVAAGAGALPSGE
jgi:hypothetical protein